MIFVYIDPGAGSVLVQEVLAGVLDLPSLLRNQVRAVMTRLWRASDDRSDD